MTAEVDLHIHSNKSSDGELSSLDIVRLSQKKRIRAVSIADHDTVAAYPEALHHGKNFGIEVIPSVELTTRFEKREFHLLLPFVDWSHEIIIELVAEVARKRLMEAKSRVQKLQELGIEVLWEDVEREAGSFPPVGVTIALAFLKRAQQRGDPLYKKYYDDKSGKFAPLRFYEDYLMEGKEAFIPRMSLDLSYVLGMVSRTGAVPVLSHPGAYFMRASRTELSFLKEKGLQGIEVFTSYHDDHLTERYRRIAEELDLVPTAGSDFHGAYKPDVPFGSLQEGGYGIVERLKQRRQQ